MRISDNERDDNEGEEGGEYCEVDSEGAGERGGDVLRPDTVVGAG